MSADVLLFTIVCMVMLAYFSRQDFEWIQEDRDFWYKEALRLLKKENYNRGSSLDELLDEYGIRDECTAIALRRVADMLEEENP